jgi:hypothetical protein
LIVSHAIDKMEVLEPHTLTDKGYLGAGIGVLVPIKGSNLAPG